MGVFEQNAEKMISKISDETREANSSLEGYLYQIDQTLNSILLDTHNRNYMIEKIEDYSIYYKDEINIYIETTQVKYHNKHITKSILYKPIFLGYLSYLSFLENKDMMQNVNFSINLIVGSPEGFTVDISDALNCILQHAPYKNSYTGLRTQWEKNFEGTSPRFAVSEQTKKDYISILNLVHGPNMDELKASTLNAISMSHAVMTIDKESYYAIYWNYLRKSKDCSINKNQLVDRVNEIVTGYTASVDKDKYLSREYNEYCQNNIISIVDNCFQDFIEEIEEQGTYNSGLQPQIISYQKEILPLLHDFLLCNFDTREKRLAFINTITPGKVEKQNSKLDYEVNLFLTKSTHIYNIIKKLSRLIFILGLTTIDELQDIIDTNGKIWKIVKVEKRGTGTLMASVSDPPIHQVFLGRIANKHEELKEYTDVWYLQNIDIGISCNRSFSYNVDLTSPGSEGIINEKKIEKKYHIECMNCLKINEIDNSSPDCLKIFEEGCPND